LFTPVNCKLLNPPPANLHQPARPTARHQQMDELVFENLSQHWKLHFRNFRRIRSSIVKENGAPSHRPSRADVTLRPKTPEGATRPQHLGCYPRYLGQGVDPSCDERRVPTCVGTGWTISTAVTVSREDVGCASSRRVASQASALASRPSLAWRVCHRRNVAVVGGTSVVPSPSKACAFTGFLCRESSLDDLDGGMSDTRYCYLGSWYRYHTHRTVECCHSCGLPVFIKPAAEGCQRLSRQRVNPANRAGASFARNVQIGTNLTVQSLKTG
jgi:hypothetical protein